MNTPLYRSNITRTLEERREEERRSGNDRRIFNRGVAAAYNPGVFSQKLPDRRRTSYDRRNNRRDRRTGVFIEEDCVC